MFLKIRKNILRTIGPKLMQEIINERYSPNEWNIYGAQASDGDNWNDDSPLCSKLLTESILPQVQYFAYVEITKRNHQALWEEYAKLEASHSLVRRPFVFPPNLHRLKNIYRRNLRRQAS